jgi:hypothetical protein
MLINFKFYTLSVAVKISKVRKIENHILEILVLKIHKFCVTLSTTRHLCDLNKFFGYLNYKFTQIYGWIHSKLQINRKFHVITEIGSTFFGCWSVTGQLKK